MSRDGYPPFTEIGMASLALIVAGGIYLASHLPEHVPLGPAAALLAASAVLLIANLASLRRVQAFAWSRFYQVAGWALLAYSITAGMIEYAFVQDHVGGGALIILTLSIIVYALQVPTLIAFTVARWETAPSVEPDRFAA